MPEPIVQVSNLLFSYPDGTQALRGIDLSILARERVGLIGPNGSGKSTLLMCMSGLLTGQGSVSLEGKDVSLARANQIRDRVGLIFQSPDDQLFMPTLADDLAFGPINQGLSDAQVHERVHQVAEQMGLNKMLDRAPHHLSMGQKRNAAIAAVLAMHPAVLLMDEPSSNLDPRSRRHLIDVLLSLDATMLIASHDLALVGRVCQRVVVIDEGLIVADGPTAEIIGSAELMERHGLEAWRDGHNSPSDEIAHDLSVLIDVTEKMATTFELAPLLRTIESAVRSALDCDRATIFLHDAKKLELHSMVATGIGEIRFPAHVGIAGQAAQTRNIIHVPDAYADKRFNPAVDRETGYRTNNLLTFPLLAPGGELIGVLQALNKLHGPFNQSDIDLAKALSSLTGVALKRQMLLDEAVIKQKLERDLNIARQIQQQLLPQKNPHLANFDIAGWNQPADETGGDLYDFLHIDEHRVAFMIADATGHGIGPALIVAQCRSLLRAVAMTDSNNSAPDSKINLATVATKVNNLLYEDLPDDRFVTACYGILDARTHQLDYISAGQGPLLLYRAAHGTIEPFPATGMPFGILENAPIDLGEPIQLQPGDMFLLLTDGFTEWARPDGQLYGDQRMAEIIHQHSSQTSAELIQTIYQDVLRFGENTPQLDDLTAIVIKRTG